VLPGTPGFSAYPGTTAIGPAGPGPFAAAEQVREVDGYDAVVLGSAVYAGHWLKPAREPVGRLGTFLADRPVWLFSSGPVGDPPKPEGDFRDWPEIRQWADEIADALR
jgi:menaquinone-dependent protoporphyrinogen IX oxidase